MDTAFGQKTKSLLSKVGDLKKVIIIAVIAIVVIVAAIIFFVSSASSKSLAASDALSDAYVSFAQGQQDQGLALLNDVIAKYPKTSAAYQASLFLGDYYISLGNFNDALTYLSKTSTDAKPSDLRPLALARIIYVWDLRNEFINAKDASENFIKTYPDHFLTKSIYISLARYYAILGSLDDVKRICNDILTKFPATEEATIADNTLNALGR
jgi:predicted negative regulator of RcsB-dependent stress response